MFGATAWPPGETEANAIAGVDYEPLGEAGVPERLYFRRRGSSNFNLHAVRLGGRHWVSNIMLREHLRTHAAARERYARAKQAAIAGGAVTLLAYSRAKADVVAALLQEALAEQNAS